MKCDKCGNQLPEGATFCNMCGTSLTPTVTNVSTEQSKGIDIKVIVIIVLVVILLALGIVFIVTNNKNTNKESNNVPTNNASLDPTITTTEEVVTDKINYAELFDFKDFKVSPEDNSTKSKNIKFIKAYSKNAKIGSYIDLLFENNNDEIYDGTVYLNYYKNGKRIDSDLTSVIYVKPHSQFSVSIDPSIYEEFDSFDITYESHMKSSNIKEIPVDNSKITTNKDSNDKIVVNYTNDYNEKGNFTFLILYKKNGEVVGVRSGSAFDIEPGAIASYDFSDYYSPKTGYDDYEVLIQSAYTHNRE
jgi:uncharacterized membrane protein YvbJ